MATWHLYIDETGNFSDQESCVAVVGLLVREKQTDRLVQEFRLWWESAVPEVPWPPHATVVREPVAWVVWRDRFKDPMLRQAADALAAMFAETEPALWAEVGQDVKMNHKPSQRARDRLAGVAQLRVPAHWDRIRQRQREVMESESEFAARLVHPSGAASAMVVLSAEGDGHSSAKNKDRYLGLLSNVLRRSGDVVLQVEPAGSHTLRIGALQRRVADPTLQHVVAMNMSHLNQACVTASKSADRSVRRAKVEVRLVPDAIPSFDSDTPSGFALADFLANQAYVHILHRGQGLATLCQVLADATGLPLRFAPSQLPTTASSGRPQEWIERARAGFELGEGQVWDLLTNMQPWAREQALAWASHLP